MCHAHYERWRYHQGRQPSARPIARRKVNDSDWLKFCQLTAMTGDGCWLWSGNVNPDGYGRVAWRRADGVSRTGFAHRFAYERLVGPVPDGLVLDHLCRNTVCVRPDHLEPVTDSENSRRANAARRSSG